MLNIVIPMAGRGQRFRDAGYNLPKPLIPLHGKPMIEVVVRNLRPSIPHRFIFLVLEDHLETFDLTTKLRKITPECEIVPVNQVTEGAACTVLLAREYINNGSPLMIANSDQFVEINIDDYVSAMNEKSADGLIMTMKADDPKWSFVGFDSLGAVNRVLEKEVISDEATVGIYNFSKGADFVKYAESMIAKNIRVNNEFYVAPVYNGMIESGCKIAIYNIGEEGHGMHGLGTPSDLKDFLEKDILK